MKKVFVALSLLFHSIAFCGEYLDVTENTNVSLPADLYYKKDYRVQWWYFTGHIFDSSGREFGYELTFFIVNVQKREFRSQFGVNRIYVTHFAISDIHGAKFYFSDKADAGAYGYAGAGDGNIMVWVDNNVLERQGDIFRIKAEDSEKTLDLRLIPNKPFVLNGDNGYSRKSEESPFIASLYFSLMNLETEGEISLGDTVFKVKGKSWFDREISSRGLGQQQAGWDWFAIQLDDNREIMLYVLRKKDGSIDRFSSGTFVRKDGSYKHLMKDDFSVAVSDHYRSKKTGARYPSRWEIRIPSEDMVLSITPLLKDQEIPAYSSTGNHYWEGTCMVEGSARGRAYVEMTGY
jgi:predicted secreted hydrolase